MNNTKNLSKYYYFVLIIFLINLSFSNQTYHTFFMEISKEEEELGSFLIKNDDRCKWVPSLLFPLPVVPPINNINASEQNPEITFQLENPIIQEEPFDLYLCNFLFLNQQFNVSLGKPRSSSLKTYYLGLGLKQKEGSQLSENYFLLNKLKNCGAISKKIFSFDKWNLNNESFIKTNLFFGSTHEHFQLKEKNAIIGTCKTDKDDIYWGCSFDQMSFNENFTSLKNGNNNYKIYFSSENHKIIFPEKFETNFNTLTNDRCSYSKKHVEETERFVKCDDFFNEEGYASLQLISQNMNITIQIDNVNRFNQGNEPKNKTRILFKNLDYFIFPLIMFKNFHIQFDGEKNLISFYTTDSSILQIKEDGKNKEKGSSKGLIAFIIILIILLLLGLCYFVFWFIKKRRGPVEKDINKYNKFDEDEHFQDMNEKRVF